MQRRLLATRPQPRSCAPAECACGGDSGRPEHQRQQWLLLVLAQRVRVLPCMHDDACALMFGVRTLASVA
jgi:hypothetical protein